MAEQKQEHGDRAMELLHQAVKSGFRNAAHMATDSDLNPLRNREDFRKLVEELEKGLPPKPMTASPPMADKP